MNSARLPGGSKWMWGALVPGTVKEQNSSKRSLGLGMPAVRYGGALDRTRRTTLRVSDQVECS